MERKSPESNESFSQVNFDFDNLPYLTNPWRKLNLHAVAIGLIKIPSNEGYTFTHSHTKQEEVYIIVEGSGKMQLNSKIIEITKGDLIRVSPATKRALKAQKNTPLFVICAGGVAEGYPQNPNARYLIDDGIPDYDDIPEWYRNNPEIKARNDRLKERMLKSQQKKVTSNFDRVVSSE